MTTAPPPTPIGSLSDAQAWLATLQAGDDVAIGSANFTPAVVQQLFALLPDGDPLMLTAIKPDATAATLIGTATILGDAGCTATFAFSADADDPLLLGLTVQLPADVQWSPPFAGFAFGFGDLTAKFVPDGVVGALGLEFDCTLSVASVKLPVALVIPALPDANWTLDTTASVPLTPALLPALTGGVDPIGVIGNGFALDDFSLARFQMAFDGSAPSVTMVGIGLAYTPGKPWKIFGDAFVLTGLAFDVTAYNPFKPTDMSVSATAKTLIEDIPVDVTVHFPETAILIYVDTTSQPLSVLKVFRAFGVAPPSGFPDIQISLLQLGLYVSQGAVDFTLAIDTPFPLVGSVTMDAFHFELGLQYADKTFSAHGNLLALFSVGAGTPPTQIKLLGAYDSSGALSLLGAATNVSLNDLVTTLADKFGIEEDTIPQPIRDLTLDLIQVSFDRTVGTSTTDSFRFEIDASTTIAGAAVTMIPVIQATYDETAKTWSAQFGGTLTIVTQTHGTLEFGLTFSHTPSDNVVVASYHGTGLGFDTLAGIFQFGLPTIPADLDLDLTDIGFRYDFSTGALMFGTASANPHYGKISFVSQPIGADQMAGPASAGDVAPAAAGDAQRQHVFVLAANAGLSLADLPLIGGELAKLGTFAIDHLQAVIAQPAPVKPGAVTAINATIAAMGSVYPQVPAQGLSGPILLAGQVTIGSNPPKPFSVSLGGSSAAQGQSLARAIGAPFTAPRLATAASDGGFWVQVQKSFGPVTIQKVGVRYSGGTLWALLNADLSVGPLGIGLIGLGAGSPLSSFQPRFTVSGITVTLAAGPVTFAGALVGELDPLNLYGAISVGLPRFSVGALAGYAQFHNHPSFFLYGTFNGPIGGPAFFFVTGLAVGFGFNRTLVVPEVGGLENFPLIEWAVNGGPSSAAGGDVITQVTNAMSTLADSGVIAPAIGQYWFAAGIRFSSFELLDTFALFTVIAGDHVEIDLLGMTTLSLPPEAPTPLAVAQLALEAAFIPSEGVIRVAGQLTSRSYVLSPDCHLTGGFAFYMWFSGDNAGQFVLSIGGYSPHYQKPLHYPDVPRVGLNWQLGSNLSIKGDLFFALTPSAVMAGGGMSAVWSSGAISAWFDAEADFLLLFNPLHYYISISVDLGASVKIDLWFTSFTISIHIGVGAKIWGPPFAVEIDVDLSIVSFSITFGAATPPPDYIKWAEFVSTVLPQAGKQKKLAHPRSTRLAPMARLGDPGDPPAPVLQITATTGILKTLPPVPGAATPLDWLVDGEAVQISVATTIPLNTQLAVASSGGVQLLLDPADTSPPTNAAVGIGPTNTKPGDFSSALTVTATSDEDSVILVDRILTAVPKAIWQQRHRDGNGVPQNVDPMNDTVLSNVLTGALLVPKAPDPQASLPVPLQWLQYTTAPGKPPLAWSQPVLVDTDPFADQTVHATITGNTATANRAQLIAAINRAGFAVDTQPDVGDLAVADSGALLAPPLLRYLVEAR